MRKFFYFVFASLLAIVYACNEETIVNTPADNKDYFPAKEGSKFIYDLVIDSSLNLNGVRVLDIIGTTKISGTDYFIEIDSLLVESSLSVDTNYFRKSNTGVFYYSDTTGISELVPDSLVNLLRIDSECRLLFFPLQINQTWPVFQIDISVGGIPVFSPVKVNARVIESQQINIAFRDTQYIAEVFKIEYKMEVQLDPQGSSESLIAYGYITENIGFIKWEGESFLISLIRGGKIDLNATTGLITEELRSYFIP